MMKKILLLFCLVFGLSFVPTAQAAMISEKQEIEMGERAGKALEAQYGLYQDDEVASRIDRIGKALAAHSTRQIPYTFKVLNTQDVNALACPGGFIYVYKGLVDTMTSDDELAAVLGHEIGHIEKRHTVHQIEKQMALSLLTILAGAASGDPGAGLALASTVSSALMASYSRGDEREADQEGFRLVKEAGFNPYGAAVTMAKLEDLAKDYGNPEYGLYSSHPEPEARLKAKPMAMISPFIGPASWQGPCIWSKREALWTGLISFPLTATAQVISIMRISASCVFMTVTARWEKASVMERCALRNSSRNGRQLRLIGKRRKKQSVSIRLLKKQPKEDSPWCLYENMKPFGST